VSLLEETFGGSGPKSRSGPEVAPSQISQSTSTDAVNPALRLADTRVATRPAAACSQAKAEALSSAWAWAASLNPESLPLYDMMQSARRLPRSLQQDFDLMVAMVLSRLNVDPHDVAANNIMFLIPRIVLRRDPAKGDTAHNSGRTDYLITSASTPRRCPLVTA
jgi:hypothetical protein